MRATFSHWSLTLLVLMGVGVSAAQADKLRELPEPAFFSPTGPVLRLRIELDKAAMDSLRREPRKFVRGRLVDLTAGTNLYESVAIHLKGAAGSFRGIDDKAALTINLDKFKSGQHFHGLKKIHLNNSVQDSSYSTEHLCGMLFHEAGVPSPRAGNARVWINGRDRGFYVIKEGFNKNFLRRYFPDATGNFYDGGFLHDIHETLEKDFGEGPDDRSDLRALAAAARVSDPAKRWERLNEVLDMDRFIRFVAMDMLIWDWDGYPLNRNNYRLYHNPDTGKFVFIPHGLDQMFWDANGSVMAGVQGVAAGAVLSTPQGKALYRERLVDLFTNVFLLEKMTNVLGQLHARNRPTVAELGSHQARELDGGVAVVFDRITSRWRGVQRQLKPWVIAPPLVLSFSNNLAVVAHWRAEEERPNETGRARLTRLAGPGDIAALSIIANAASTASWRSSVKLDPGRYRFEGLAASAAVVPLERKPPTQPATQPPTERKGSGAGLRISGIQAPRQNQLVGTSYWTRLGYDFEVQPGSENVELVCELRATSGQAWFATESLQVVKLP